MKKILIISLVLLSCGCNIKKKGEKEIKDEGQIINIDDQEIEPIIDDPIFIDDNPITIGVYNDRKLIKNYKTVWENDIDIGSFEVFFTNVESLPNTAFQPIWNQYYEAYTEDISKYRIGYHINFKMQDGTIIDKNILRPKDVDDLFNIIQIYLYDDVHQPVGKWYSHVTDEEYNDNTILSSIKLTNSGSTSQINSNINIDVFVYDQDDLDALGNYIGNCIYTFTVERQ